MKVTINVTQEDINNGKRTEPNSCPISLAARRAFHVDYLHVNYSLIHNGAVEPNLFVRYATVTSVMYDFITRFDNGEPVKPRKFVVESLIS